jgi:uncharacterized membrane protein YkvA (DUF1232 family)
MKKLLGTITLLKGLRGAKKAATYNTTWKEDAKDVAKMIRATWNGDFRIQKRNIFLMLLCLVYILNPFDFLPAIALGPIGLIDDAAVLVFVYKRITGELERFRREAKYQEAEVVS